MFDTIFAKKEDAAHVPAVRLVTIWFGECRSPPLPYACLQIASNYLQSAGVCRRTSSTGASTRYATRYGALCVPYWVV